MSDKLCILCPGQGAQAVGMGKDFHAVSPIARDTFDTANRILGFDLAGLCFAGPEERLNQTDISQPAIFATSVAAFRAAVSAGKLQPGASSVYAGLSLGEYTALHLAGVFSFEEGLKLVAARGRYMQEAAVATPGGMVAILGADDAQVDELCTRCAQGDVLVPANYNAPGQIVVSGSVAACQRILSAAEAGGFKAMPLKVAGAFHSSLMRSAAERMQAELEKVTFASPRATVFANVTAAPHADPASIKQLLVRQIVSPVKWSQTMRALLADADLRFVELAPGRTLAGLAKRINRRLAIDSLASADALTTNNGQLP